jgi:hypothetical protein
MKIITPQANRILGIAPTPRGFGFAVVEHPGTLVDWDLKNEREPKTSARIILGIIEQYGVGTIVLTTPSVRHAPRVADLNRGLKVLGRKMKVPVEALTAQDVKKALFGETKLTKHDLASVVAERFPNEIKFRLPPKRKPWMHEDNRLGIFGAVALALAYRALEKERKTAEAVGN